MRYGVGLCLLGAAWAAAVASADTITIDGTKYEGVVVTQSANMYYVQVPVEGTTMSALKTDVKREDVIIESDKEKREALLAEWRANNALRSKDGDTKKPAAIKKPRTAPAPRPPAGTSLPPPLPVLAPDRPGFYPNDAAGMTTRDSANGVREKRATVDEKGVPTVVLRGNRQKDSGFEARVEEQRRQAAERAQEQAPPPDYDYGGEGTDGAVGQFVEMIPAGPVD